MTSRQCDRHLKFEQITDSCLFVLFGFPGLFNPVEDRSALFCLVRRFRATSRNQKLAWSMEGVSQLDEGASLCGSYRGQTMPAAVLCQMYSVPYDWQTETENERWLNGAWWMPLCGVLGKGSHPEPKAGLSITAATEGLGGWRDTHFREIKVKRGWHGERGPDTQVQTQCTGY